MKMSVGEGNQNQRPYKPFFKINPPFKAIEHVITLQICLAEK